MNLLDNFESLGCTNLVTHVFPHVTIRVICQNSSFKFKVGSQRFKSSFQTDSRCMLINEQIERKVSKLKLLFIISKSTYFSDVIQYLISVSKIVSLLAGSLINGVSQDKGKSVQIFSIFSLQLCISSIQKEQLCGVFQSQSMKVCIRTSV